MDQSNETSPLIAGYSERPRREPYREFLLTVADQESFRYTGFGLTLDDVIGECVQDFESNDGDAAESAESDDQVLWRSGRVVALLLPKPDGTLSVVRIDRDTRP